MADKYHHIAEIMGDVCHDILWLNNAPKIHQAMTGITFNTRIGNGLATYCRYDKYKKHCTINFGRKMIASKFKAHEIHDWLTSREISRYKYFDGEITLLNVLTHTICHEFSHFIQQIHGQSFRGSIHNSYFYTILDSFYSNFTADKVRSELAIRCQQKQIQLEFDNSELPLSIQTHYQKDDKISFQHGNKTRHGVITNVNRKTVTVVTTDKLFRRQLWRVPYSHLIKSIHNSE